MIATEPTGIPTRAYPSSGACSCRRTGVHFAGTCAGGLVKRFFADARGATAVEYSMIAAGVGVAVASAVWSLGTAMKTTFYDKLAALF